MYVVSAITSPYWGKLADQKGRKLMILRAFLGMAIVIAAMGAVQNVWELMVLRMLQGVFAGFVSNANSLIATETPKKQAGANGVWRHRWHASSPFNGWCASIHVLLPDDLLHYRPYLVVDLFCLPLLRPLRGIRASDG